MGNITIYRNKETKVITWVSLKVEGKKHISSDLIGWEGSIAVAVSNITDLRNGDNQRALKLSERMVHSGTNTKEVVECTLLLVDTIEANRFSGEINYYKVVT